MVDRGFFAHESLNGATVRDRVARTGYLHGRWSARREHRLDVRPVAAGIVQAWMDSRGHRAMILHRAFQEAGVGVAAGIPSGGGGATYTMDFGLNG
jgi:uncharacterized protein YkwD